MIDTAIMAAIISGATTLLVCLFNNYFVSKRSKEQSDKQLEASREQNDKQLALLDLRLAQMEKKQDKHNNMMERLAVIEHDIDEMKHDIHEIERHEKEHEELHHAI